MDSYLLEQKTYDRTLEWNEAGWTGKGVNVWDMESPTSSHGKRTHQRILHAAPEANVINASHYGQYQNGDAIKEGVEGYGTAQDFITSEQIGICSVSIGGYNGYSGANFYRELREKNNLIMFESAGNDGPDDSNADSGNFLFVGAMTFMKGVPQMAGYSSGGTKFEQVDFSTFAGPGYNGTSFSCPYLAGIAALIRQRYGRDMTQEEMYAYLKMIAKPIDTGRPSDVEGYDYWSGWGIPILPHVDKQYVVMEIGRKAFKVDGAWVEMDTAPFIEKQRTFVPIAFAAIALGAQVYWDNDEHKVTILKGGKTVEMFIGSRKYTVNGEERVMDVAPFIKDQRTFVPIAFAALALDCKVAWVASERKVLILEQ